ncbi:MAG: hypothetical protein FWG87_13625 [Defluviitaleaceae bacterium]|nr:hypothetical protein [Defluviitaleaceae bacterium]
MITKMKYISITGHIAGMNHAVNNYLSRYDIQLEENPHSLMKPFTSLNPYAQTLRKAEALAPLAGSPPPIYIPILPDEAVNLVEDTYTNHELRDIEEKTARLEREAAALEKYSALEIDLAALKSCEFIYCRMGRLSAENFKKFEKFSDKRFLFSLAKREKDVIYGIFFTPTRHSDEMDTFLVSLGFTQDCFSAAQGTPSEISQRLRAEADKLLQGKLFSCTRERLAIACERVKSLYAAFDIKKYASISNGERIFTFWGWLSAEDARALENEIAADDLLIFAQHERNEKPPVALHNLPIIRRFEFFTRIYGLPEYDEIDPTPILAITYTLLFGLMFGDIGHGAALAFIGIFVQRRHHVELGEIMKIVGISSAVFGFLYGSVFGYEFKPIWLRPTANITETLVFATILGAGLIAFSMLLNMYNSFRQQKIADLLFGANGIAGFVFYSCALWLAARVIRGLPITSLVVCVAVLPLVFICFKRPTEKFLAGERIFQKPSQLIGESIIEVFETLLTYATNTISFVRVGAFAVSHAGMMHVVLQLGSSRNLLILIIGNAAVIIIEGLLVGIQVLRLDFYEIFSRFYKGTGKAFTKTYR